MAPLRSDRLSLRPLCLADAPFVLRLLTDPGWLRHIGDKGVRDLEGARQYIADGPQAMYARHGHGLWLVESVSERTPMGLCGLLRRQGLADPDLGFAFLPEHRGRGLAHEAARLVLDHATGVLALDRVLAIVQPDNAGSVRLLGKLGFGHAGEVRLPGATQTLALYAWSP